MNIGYSIKRIRQLNSITQNQLANELYYSCQTISNWERNLSTPPIQVLTYLSNNYNVPLADLIDNKSNHNEYDIINKVYEVTIKCFKQNIKINLRNISYYTNINENHLKNYFHDDEQLLLFFIDKYENVIFQDILKLVKSYNSYIDFIMDHVIYILYKNRDIITLFYSNEYIESFWKNYLIDKYYYTIINHFEFSTKENVKIFIIVFVNLLQNWFNKKQIMSVEKFKSYLLKMFNTKINQL